MYHSIVKIKNFVVLSFSILSFKVASVYMLPQSSDTFTKSSDMLNKNTPGVKRCEANKVQKWPSDKANHTCENML